MVRLPPLLPVLTFGIVVAQALLRGRGGQRGIHGEDVQGGLNKGEVTWCKQGTDTGETRGRVAFVATQRRGQADGVCEAEENVKVVGVVVELDGRGLGGGRGRGKLLKGTEMGVDVHVVVFETVAGWMIGVELYRFQDDVGVVVAKAGEVVAVGNELTIGRGQGGRMWQGDS